MSTVMHGSTVLALLELAQYTDSISQDGNQIMMRIKKYLV